MSPQRPWNHCTLPPKLILISTKAYFTPDRSLSYLRALLDPSNGILPFPVPATALLLAFIPDFLTIYPSAEILNQHCPPWPLALGAQDCFWDKDTGPYTGEIVPSLLSALGCTIVEVGHAERRKLLSETDETTAKKAAAVSACDMIPLVCIGELDPPPSSGPMSMAVGNALAQLTPQITSVLKAIPPDVPVIFAYEPVWAIGAQQPAAIDHVGPIVRAIREVVKTSSHRTGDVRVVYGGSAGPGLWSGRSNGGNPLGTWVDGMFLGRFAHEIKGVKEVVDEVIESIKRQEEEGAVS